MDSKGIKETGPGEMCAKNLPDEDKVLAVLMLLMHISKCQSPVGGRTYFFWDC